MKKYVCKKCNGNKCTDETPCNHPGYLKRNPKDVPVRICMDCIVSCSKCEGTGLVYWIDNLTSE